MLPFKDAETLSLLYHLNSEPWLNEEAYNDPFPGHRIRPPSRPDELVRLPHSDRETFLRALLRRRRSCRHYAARPMPLSTLAALLETACSVTDLWQAANGVAALSRPFPSAGGLYPLDYLLAAVNVTGLDEGIYRYDVVQHRLEPQQTGAVREELGAHLMAQHFLRNANLVVFLAATFARTQTKYGPRGYRYVLLEAGHAAQTICLAASEADLGALCVGGFRDARLNRFLGLDGRREAVVYCVGIGYADGQEVQCDFAPDNVS